MVCQGHVTICEIHSDSVEVPCFALRRRFSSRAFPSRDGINALPCGAGERDIGKDHAATRAEMERVQGFCRGNLVIDHLGMVIDTNQMEVFVQDRKTRRVREIASKLRRGSSLNRRVVSTSSLRRFTVVCISLMHAMPLARYYTRAIYTNMSRVWRKYPHHIEAPVRL